MDSTSVVFHNFKAKEGNVIVSSGEYIECVYRVYRKRDLTSKVPTGADVFDLHGHMALPGFIDAHSHMQQWGLRLFCTDLSSARSWAEALRMLENAKTSWIFGVDYDETRWPSPPRQEDLNRFDRPAVIRRVCGHRALANDLALDEIERRHPEFLAESGLNERGALLLPSLITRSPDEMEMACSHAALRAFSSGITSIHEISSFRSIHSTKLRVTYYTPVFDERLPSLDGRGYKFFADGSIGSGTAAITRPYRDGGTGSLFWDDETFLSLLWHAAERGAQIMVHAIGDRAIAQTLRLIAEVSTSADLWRPRIEHLEMPSPRHLRVLRSLHGVASMQPNFVSRWSGRWGLYHQRLGWARVRRMNPFRSILTWRIPLAFGSDSMPPGPIYGLKGALHHPNTNQRLSVAETVRAYTEGGAFAEGEEQRKGTIKEGFFCDLAFLKGSFPEVEVVATVVGGTLTFDRTRCLGGSG